MDKFNFIVSNHISWQNIENTVFIFDENNNGEIMVLEEVSAYFWCNLNIGCSIEEIAFKVAREYSVEHSRVKNDIYTFIESLRDANVIAK